MGIDWIIFTNPYQLTLSKIVAVSKEKPKKSGDWSIDDYQIPGYSLHPINLHMTTGSLLTQISLQIGFPNKTSLKL